MKLEPLRVLIVDDESLAREHIKELLQAMSQNIIAWEAINGPTAVTAIKELQPDVVFLDVEMPGLSGIDVIREIGADKMPVTIFVTAYDRYAVKAFELAAVDYLLKPLNDERFKNALQRARTLHEMRHSSETDASFHKALEYLSTIYQDVNKPPPSTAYVERFAIESRSQVRIVVADEIDYITASGPYVELHVGTKAHLIRDRMQILETKLDPKAFLRIHRSIIVQLNRVDVLQRHTGGDYNLRLKNGTTLQVSRNRIVELERWMGVPTGLPRESGL